MKLQNVLADSTDEYLTKPIDRKKLIAMIESYTSDAKNNIKHRNSNAHLHSI